MFRSLTSGIIALLITLAASAQAQLTIWPPPSSGGGGSGDMVSTNNLSDVANAGTSRTNLGLAIGTNVQAFDADLSTYAGITPSANVQSFLGAANYAAMKTQLALTIGTNVEAWDADLDTYAGITPSANVQSFLGAANYAGMKTQLALTIGTNVEAWDADLDTYAGITPSANVQSFLGAANYAAMKTQLALTIGTNVEAWDADLDYLAGFTPSANVKTVLNAADNAAIRAAISAARTDAAQTFTGTQTVDRIKGTVGSYTVTADGANTFSVKTCTGSDMMCLVSLTPSSTGNTSSNVVTISGFNWGSTPTSVALVPLNNAALVNQTGTKALNVANITSTQFDLVGGSVGIVNGTALTFTIIAIVQ